MNCGKKIIKLRADLINKIKSNLLNKGDLNISGEYELKPFIGVDKIYIKYYDINGIYYSGYFVKFTLSNDKLYFYTNEDIMLTPCDLDVEKLAEIADWSLNVV